MILYGTRLWPEKPLSSATYTVDCLIQNQEGQCLMLRYNLGWFPSSTWKGLDMKMGGIVIMWLQGHCGNCNCEPIVISPCLALL